MLEGNLLQPDRPLLAVDATFARPGQDGRGEPSGICKSSWMSECHRRPPSEQMNFTIRCV